MRIDEVTYRRLYPTGASPPKFYGLPKVHKSGMQLRPIVSSIGSVMCETSRELSRILKPLVGRSPQQVWNNKKFIQQLEDIKLRSDDIIMPYDVKALFTLVPIKPALKITEETPARRSNTTTKNIHDSEQHHLSTGVLSQQYIFYLQRKILWAGRRSCYGLSHQSHSGKLIYGGPWDESHKYITTTPLWCGKDLWMIHFSSSKQLKNRFFLDHIKFTAEEPRPDGSMPFLDILVTPCEDESLATTVFRKPMHTDLYMQWDSHHAISSKYSMIGTLHHRANTICSSPKLLQQEERHLKRILTRCKYPVWALNRVKMKMKTLAQKNQKKNKSCNTGHQQQNPHIVVPY